MSFHLPASKFYPYEPDPLALDSLKKARELTTFIRRRYGVTSHARDSETKTGATKRLIEASDHGTYKRAY